MSHIKTIGDLVEQSHYNSVRLRRYMSLLKRFEAICPYNSDYIYHTYHR